MPALILETDRLILRHWQPADRDSFAAINADPRVMEFMPAVLSRIESDHLVDRIEQHFEQHGFGLYAAEHLREKAFIGFVGLNVPSFDALFTPCVEIGWRLAASRWGQGFATEGARAVAQYAFSVVKLDQIVSFTVPENIRSRRVMEKLGMDHDPADDFEHPGLPPGHPLRRHVLYRLLNPRSPKPRRV